MKIKHSCGSALLLVFIVSFVLSLAALRCWRISGMMCDIQYQREFFYKRFYLTQRIFDSVIDLACKNFDEFLQFKKPTNVDVNFCVAHVTVSKFKKSTDCLVLSVGVVQKNEIVCNLRCLLERKIGSQGDQSKNKRIYFVVSNFTLSSSL